MIDAKLKTLIPAEIVDTMDSLNLLTNAPYEMTFPIVMSVANFAAQGRYNVETIVWTPCPISLFFMALAPSGGMKSGITSYVMIGVNEFVKQQQLATKQSLTQYKIDFKFYNKELDRIAKDPLNSGPNPTLPEKPRGYKYKIEKGTTNGIISTLDSVPFAGIFNTDAAEFFNSYSFQDKTKAIEMISMLSKLWSGEEVQRNTGVEDTNVDLYNRRFSMLALLQQQLATFLENTQYKDQGFLNRILISQCGLFLKPFVDINKVSSIKTNQQLLDPFNDRILAMLQDNIKNQIKQHAQAARFGKEYTPNELVLETIKFTDSARKIMVDFYNKCNNEMFLPENKEYVNFVSRMYEQAVRMAATFAIFVGDKEINERFAEAGCLLAEMYLAQRKSIEVDGEVKEDLVTKCVGQMRALIIRDSAKGRKINKRWASQYGTALYRKGLSEEQRDKVWDQLERREMEKDDD